MGNFNNRIGEENVNKQGCLMKIVNYNNANDIVVEFQDDYHINVHTTYRNFINKEVKNPYFPSVCGIGIIGNKYPIKRDGKCVKEYNAWRHMLSRCVDKKQIEKRPTYEDAACCNEWLLYDNFYEWLHNQPNFNKWFYSDKWAIDKDILNKNNKVYSPENCTLVPIYVNSLFTKRDNYRGDYPVGVSKDRHGYRASCNNAINNSSNKRIYIGEFKTPESAFYAYKEYKESIIKKVAKDEYAKGNITEECYNAMMKYEVEITD